jgi:hypothetical protein
MTIASEVFGDGRIGGFAGHLHRTQHMPVGAGFKPAPTGPLIFA